MAYPDIERAREDQDAVRRIIEAHAGPEADLRALRRVVDLCRALAEAVDDEYCRAKIRVIADSSAELLSQGEHRSRGALSGVDYLRQQARGALELLESRLYSLERSRRYGQHSFVPAAYGAPNLR